MPHLLWDHLCRFPWHQVHLVGRWRLAACSRCLDFAAERRHRARGSGSHSPHPYNAERCGICSGEGNGTECRKRTSPLPHWIPVSNKVKEVSREGAITQGAAVFCRERPGRPRDREGGKIWYLCQILTSVTSLLALHRPLAMLLQLRVALCGLLGLPQGSLQLLPVLHWILCRPASSSTV